MDANYKINNLTDKISEIRTENITLKEMVKDYGRLRNTLGDDQVDDILLQAKLAEQAEKAEQQAKKQAIRSKKNYYER